MSENTEIKTKSARLFQKYLIYLSYNKERIDFDV